jgi:hypothetical protein
MGLRCLLGHEYGTPELQRDREEQGGEVVVTVREVKTCTRCGEERVVSENKEITSITTPSEIEELADEGAADATVEHADDVESVGAEATDGPAANDEPQTADDTATSETPAAADADADAATAEADAGADAPDDGGVEFLDGSDDADPEPAPAAAGPGAAADAPTDDGPSAEEDDGVILDDDAEPPAERGHGEWPDADDVRSDDERTPTLEEVREAADADEESASDETVDDDRPAHDDAEVVSETEHDRAQWPEQVGDDEGFAAEPDDGEPTDVSFSGLSPSGSDTVRDVTSGDAGYDAEFVGNGSNQRAAGANGGQITRTAELDTSPGSGGGEPTAYVCPECGLRRAAEGASLRAGDICPECRRGYIAEERD